MTSERTGYRALDMRAVAQDVDVVVLGIIAIAANPFVSEIAGGLYGRRSLCAVALAVYLILRPWLPRLITQFAPQHVRVIAGVSHSSYAVVEMPHTYGESRKLWLDPRWFCRNPVHRHLGPPIRSASWFSLLIFAFAVQPTDFAGIAMILAATIVYLLTRINVVRFLNTRKFTAVLSAVSWATSGTFVVVSWVIDAGRSRWGVTTPDPSHPYRRTYDVGPAYYFSAELGRFLSVGAWCIVIVCLLLVAVDFAHYLTRATRAKSVA